LSSLPPYQEKSLLQEIAKGNEKAFRSFYDAYFNRLSAYIFKLCKSDMVTEEIVQDIFIKLWESRAFLVTLDTPEAYIFSMARNRTIDHLRRVARETSLIAVIKQQLQASDNEIEDRFDAADLGRLIEEALRELSPQKREVFRLRNSEGLDHDEIATVMQLSRSTVKNHLSQTLQHLRRYLSRSHRPGTLLLLLLSFSGFFMKK
jgi:RNA polymerase sigma-70 factor (family 1)